MRRTGIGRVSAALLLLWFAVVSGGAPAALHVCPVHDGAQAVTGSDHAAHSHDAPADGGHVCTCFGDCATGGVAPGIAAARTNIITAATVEPRAPLPAPDAPAVSAPAFVLPYANGPPGAHRVV